MPRRSLIDNAIESRRLLDEERAFRLQQMQEQAPLHEQLMEAKVARAEASAESAAYKAYKEAETSKQITAFYRGMPHLEKAYKVGTADYAEAFGEYLSNFPLAASTKEVRELAKTHALVHDEQAQLKERIANFTAATGRAPESVETTASGGVNLRAGGAKQGDSLKKFSEDIKQLHLTPNDFENPNWQTRSDGKVFTKYVDKNNKEGYVTLDPNHFSALKSRYEALTATPPQAGQETQSSEATAPQTALPAQDQYTVGKKYRDSAGNMATYLGEGKWQ